jgi:hypothetical protein
MTLEVLLQSQSTNLIQSVEENDDNDDDENMKETSTDISNGQQS